MKKNSNQHRSFQVSEQLFKSKKMQCITNILLGLLLVVQVYGLIMTIKLFDTIQF